ncbi:MAG: HlyC/CorC family transporter [Dehalococcoidales bacterium]|jgi:putative hemolysin|nr:HlyC/CorC family transporter [Dehalococcoidales bacterium]
MTVEALYLVLLVICVLFSAFFSSSETAFTSLERFRLQHMVESNVGGAKRVARLLEKPERFLSTILLGNNLVNTAATAIATTMAISIWGDETGVLIATVGMTIILLIFGETTPKTFAKQHAERVSTLFVRPVEWLSWLFYPVVFILSWIAAGITRLIGGKSTPSTLVSADEIKTMITVGHKEGTVDENEADLLNAVFDFGDNPVSDVLVPRLEVVGVEKGKTIAEFFAIYAENPMSRFPVYVENMDNIVGILSIKDVMMAQAKGTITPESLIDDLIRPAYFVPETKPIDELFAEMRDKNYRMSIIVDEYGGTAGIVSLSRLMEEIVGPVGDELAAAEKEYESIDENTFQIDGTMRIDEANDEMGLGLPEGEYETVAGFILQILGRIPKQGRQIKYRDLKIVISRMKGHKIEEIMVTREKKIENEPAQDKV